MTLAALRREYMYVRTFEDGVGFEDLLLDPRVLPADGRQELQDQLRALRLAGTRLATAAQ